jgi:hypothetical protein
LRKEVCPETRELNLGEDEQPIPPKVKKEMTPKTLDQKKIALFNITPRIKKS